MTDAVPWAPQLPNGWEVVRADQMVRRVRRPPRSTDGIITAFRDGQVTLRTNRRTEGFTEAFQEIGYQGIRVGDLVVHGMDAFAGAIGVSDSDGKASPVVHAYRERKGDTRFVAYCLRVASRLGYIQALAKGIRERSTAFDSGTFKYLRLPAPPLHEQRAIADFLDRETAKIDALIEKQSEMIGLLRERRTSTIDDAVRDAPLAAISRWWQVIDCKHDTAEFHADGEYPVASIGQVQGDFVDLSQAKRTSREWFISMREGSRRPAPGNLVMSRNATVGKVAQVLETTPPFALGQDVVLLRGRDGADSAYLRHVMTSSWATAALEGVMIGSTFRRINVAAIKRLPLPFPEAALQRETAIRLDRQTAQIDALIAKAEELIVLAKERRAALITAAVTGQIDVSGEAS